MKLTITVTKDVLERSKMCGSDKKNFSVTENCAVALAVRDIFPEAQVTLWDISPFKDCSYYIDLSEDVSQYIKQFDNTAYESRPNLPEFSFDIELPDWVIERIDISELKPLLVNHPNLTLHEV